MVSRAPGFYPDPYDPSRFRYWTGQGWSQVTHGRESTVEAVPVEDREGPH